MKGTGKPPDIEHGVVPAEVVGRLGEHDEVPVPLALEVELHHVRDLKAGPLADAARRAGPRDRVLGDVEGDELVTEGDEAAGEGAGAAADLERGRSGGR
jgi:hypothetical protein